MPSRTPKEKLAAIADDYATGMSRAELKEKHGCSVDTIRLARKAFNVPARTPGAPSRVTDDQLEAIRSDLAAGKPIGDIVKDRRVSWWTVERARNGNGRRQEEKKQFPKAWGADLSDVEFNRQCAAYAMTMPLVTGQSALAAL